MMAPFSANQDFINYEKVNWMKLDYSKISDVKVEGINIGDYPDFVDAFIASATYGDRDMAEEELDALNANHAFVWEHTIKLVF